MQYQKKKKVQKPVGFEPEIIICQDLIIDCRARPGSLAMTRAAAGNKQHFFDRKETLRKETPLRSISIRYLLVTLIS